MPGDQLYNREAERHTYRSRIYFAGVVILLLGAGLIARLYWLQVLKHDYYSTQAEDNRLRVEVVPPIRGLIFDRNGVVLAENLPSFSLEVVPTEVPDLEATLTALSKVVQLGDKELRRFHTLKKRTPKFRPVALRQNLSEAEVARFEVDRHLFPGVSLRAALVRRYPLGDAGAHVVGYVSGITEKEQERYDKNLYRGTTHTGKVGVEYSYENLLHGMPGYRIVETNAAGAPLREIEFKAPQPGANLYLTLDARLQLAADAALAPNEGAVVAIEPNTGAVLALVSRPGFDPNLFVTGIDTADYKALNEDPLKPLYNRVLQGIYPPGSTIKPMMALGGLESGVVGLGTRRSCPGYYMLPGSSRRYRCWRAAGHGSVDAAASVIQSCDVYFYSLAVAMGIDKLHDWISLFSFGHPTGIDLPREKTGIAPSTSWKQKVIGERWFPGETVSVGIGQGYWSSTPLQLAQMTSVIAQRGKAYKPHVLYATADGITGELVNRQPEALPEVKLQNPSYWNKIIEAMEDVVHGPRGTAAGISRDLKHYRIAGKTGTAQVRNMSQAVYVKSEQQRKQERDHAWFVAFAPVNEPRIALVVLGEHAGHGGSAAAPVARKVFDAWMPPPAEPELAPAALKEGRP